MGFGLLRRRKGAVAIATVAAMAAGGIAWASIPDQVGMIKGCYSQINGALRVVDTPYGTQPTCGVAENPLSITQIGPTGYRGPKGDKGDKGDPGPQGPAGRNDQHFIVADKSGNIVAKSDTDAMTWYYSTGLMWAYLPPTVADVNKCAITVTPEDRDFAQNRVTASVWRYGYGYIMVETTKFASNGAPSAFDAPLNITFSC